MHPDDYFDLTMESFIKAGRGNKYKFSIGKFGGGYSYNEENILSQDFIWHPFENEVNGECYVFLQTHNGCDARGGFSTPHVFSCDYDSFCSLISFGGYTIGCKNRHYWDFESAGYYESYTETDVKLNSASHIAYENLPIQDRILFKIGKYNPKKTIIVKDYKVFCPICVSELDAWNL